jgi:hypothetical protein
MKERQKLAGGDPGQDAGDATPEPVFGGTAGDCEPSICDECESGDGDAAIALAGLSFNHCAGPWYANGGLFSGSNFNPEDHMWIGVDMIDFRVNLQDFDLGDPKDEVSAQWAGTDGFPGFPDDLDKETLDFVSYQLPPGSTAVRLRGRLLHHSGGSGPGSDDPECPATWEMYAGNWGDERPVWGAGDLIAAGTIDPETATFIDDTNNNRAGYWIPLDVTWIPRIPERAQFYFRNTSQYGRYSQAGPDVCEPRGPFSANGQPNSNIRLLNNFQAIPSLGIEGEHLYYSLCVTSGSIPAGFVDCANGSLNFAEMNLVSGLTYTTPGPSKMIYNVWMDSVKMIRGVHYELDPTSTNRIILDTDPDTGVQIHAQYMAL